MSSEIQPRVFDTNIGAVDPSGSPECFVGKAPAACSIHVLKAYIVTATAKAAATANNNTFTLNRVRAGTATAIAVGTTDSDEALGAALVANVPFELLPLSAALMELAAGDVLQLVCTEGAAAQDLTEVACFIEWAAGTGDGL